MLKLHNSGPRALFLVALTALLSPFDGAAQQREVLFHEVSVSTRAASIQVEFADGEALQISLQEGELRVNGAVHGQYTPGGPLDLAWRSLLGQAIALDNGSLPRLMMDWSLPSGISGSGAEAAAYLQQTLTSAFSAPSAPSLPSGASGEGLHPGVLVLLLQREERLRALGPLMEGVDQSGIQFFLDDEVTVSAGETRSGSLVVVDGTSRIEGTVEGDLVILGGRVELGADARVEGDLRWSDARIEGNRRAVSGSIREVTLDRTPSVTDLREEIRREVEAGLRTGLAQTSSRSASRGLFRNVTRGVTGLVRTALAFGILLGVGLGALYFFPRNVAIVARTARNATGRSALVGLATMSLSIPVFALGAVLLTVTIIGIPLLLLWLPAFPLAMALALLLGYLAVANNLGRWAASRGLGGLDASSDPSPALQIGAGLMVLLAGYALGHLFQIFGSPFSPFRILSNGVASVLGFAAMAVGLGAVVLSRGGRDPAFAGEGWSADPAAGAWDTNLEEELP